LTEAGGLRPGVPAPRSARVTASRESCLHFVFKECTISDPDRGLPLMPAAVGDPKQSFPMGAIDAQDIKGRAMKRAHGIHGVNNHGVTGDRDPLDRNQADFPVLGMLTLGPAHGYEICHDLSDRLGGTWRLRTSHIYALLARLEVDGLVVHERVGQETRPAKKVFSLTPAGRELFSQWLKSPVKSVRQLRLEFLAKLHFAGEQPNGTAARLVKDQVVLFEANAGRLRQRMNLRQSATDRLALQFRLAMLDAAITWLTTLSERAKPVKPTGSFQERA